MFCRWIGFLVAASFLGGCARISAHSEVSPDGSFVRNVAYVVAQNTATKDASNADEFLPEKVFGIPSTGWTKTEIKNEKENSVRVSKRFAAGEHVLNDLSPTGATGSILANRVSVKPLGDGRFEYTETIEWKGRLSTNSKDLPIALKAALKEALPTELSDEAALDNATRRIAIKVWQALFGPHDPLVNQVFMHSDFAERRLMQRLAKGIDSTLVEVFQDRLSPEQRAITMKKLLANMKDKDVFEGPTKSLEEPKPDSFDAKGGLVPILVVVKLPGSIEETNGEIDAVQGEVYWAMYPEGAMLQPVTLRVVYKP
jgi:hypothetical protein